MDLDFESLRAGNFYRQGCCGGLDSPQDFAGPQFFGEQREETVLEIADRAEQIISECGVIGVHAALGQFAFDGGITRGQARSGASAKRFSRESFEKFRESIAWRSGDEE